MTAEIRIFLNEKGHTLPAGATARDAVAVGAPELVSALVPGQVTDARGLPVDLDEPLVAGSILRAARSARRESSVPDPA
jgi:hypothetical protein